MDINKSRIFTSNYYKTLLVYFLIAVLAFTAIPLSNGYYSAEAASTVSPYSNTINVKINENLKFTSMASFTMKDNGYFEFALKHNNLIDNNLNYLNKDLVNYVFELSSNNNFSDRLISTNLKASPNNTFKIEDINAVDNKYRAFLGKGTYYYRITVKQSPDIDYLDFDFIVNGTIYNEPFSTKTIESSSYACRYGESESNGSKTTATEITNFGAGNRYIGSFYRTIETDSTFSSTDLDCYKIKLNYNAAIYIGVGASYKENSIPTYSGTLTNSSGREVSSLKITDAEAPGFKTLKTKILSPGTYYLEIKCQDTSGSWGCNYSLYVENKQSISNTSLSRSTKVTCKGTPINFVKNITYGGEKLELGRDYKVEYSKGNTAPASGTFTIIGIKGFSGKRGPYAYKILPNKKTIYKKKTKVSSVAKKKSLKINWKKINTANYYQIAYRQKGAKKWKTKTVTKGITSLTVKGLKRGKKYQYKVRGIQKLKGYNTYYSKFSKTKTSKKIK